METLNKCVMLKFQAVSEKLPKNDKGYFMTRLYIGTTTLQSIYFVAVATTGGFSACFNNSGWGVCTLQSFGPVCDVLLTAQLVCLGRCLWLHWLPVCSRIQFKLSTLCFRSRTLNQPQKLSDTLHSYQPMHLLGSSTQDLMTVPRCKTVFGDIYKN